MEYTIKKLPEGAEATLTERHGEDGTVLLDLDVTFTPPCAPSVLTVQIAVPCVDMFSTWGGNFHQYRNLAPAWRRQVSESRLAVGVPVHQLVSSHGRNRFCVALSDCATPTSIATGVKEEDANIYCDVSFFTQPVNTLSAYRATIRIDESDRPYREAIRDVADWFADDCGYPVAHIPEAARRPMYSCWYSFHQHIDVDAIVEQCRLAKEMGMETVIVDDGWQTDDNGRGYSRCGDWKICPTKIPDIHDFVKRIHETGMKVMFWYSMPYVGQATKAYERFKTMLLGHTEKFGPTYGFATLDPRYPEVRQYLVGLYETAVRDWKLDGVKLDFVDSFKLFPDPPAYDERRDVQSLEDGIDRLLSETYAALTAANPEVLIEFRQNYVGPAIRKYGNMMRVADCPNDSYRNHTAIVDMRYTLGATPVHSDMLMWHKNDSKEGVAHQLICCLYSVPQISVMLNEISEEQRRVLVFWLKFWNENRPILLDGDFTADDPGAFYTQERAEKDGEIIAVAHAKAILTLPDVFRRLVFVNASDEDFLVLRAEKAFGKRQYRVLSCDGTMEESGEMDFVAGLHEIRVPRCGLVEIL